MTAEILQKYFGLNDLNVIKAILADPLQVARYEREYQGIIAGSFETKVDAFFTRWNTRYNNFDHQFGPQCKDVFSQFNNDLMHAPYILGNAKDLYADYPVNPITQKYYTRIANTWSFVPKKGDVMVWGAWSTNPYGHVSIVRDANFFYFTSFDQNYPLGSPCHFQRHSYTWPRVFGVLRPKI